VNADCLKLTTYLAEHDKTGRRFLANRRNSTTMDSRN
jgi:hypothetical protein